ncbi:MAG: hypothetical protein A3G93_07870 [Nitrospinae bacterium RIFCSPLOWO2_12_FULL_45_22]|nr:MAG: hypothetical protein A3G93_07870 [Nitrospinae bacterium RIFCSPLOWO2_12_FULL_45_22]
MNVLIYVLDCLRKDHLTVYGYSRETAPNISQLAMEGVIFDKAFSQATWTRPSAGSMLTGCYPTVHGAVTMQDCLSNKVPTLPSLLQNIGYRTAGFFANAQVSSFVGFNRGFEFYVDLFKEKEITGKRYLREKKGDVDVIQGNVFPTSEDINHYFLPWLRNHTRENFFSFLWSIDTHLPYFQGKDGRFFDPNNKGVFDGRRASIKKIKTQDDFSQFINYYDSEIYYNDYQIGEIITELKRLGIYEETMIVVLADHGEIFNDHSRIDDLFITDLLKRYRLFLRNNHYYRIRCHSSMLPYDVLINVPLIIKFPHGTFAGQRIDALVQLIDLAPTILDYLMIPDELWVLRMQGKSILPVLKESMEEINQFVFSHSQFHRHQDCYNSVRSQDQKLIIAIPPKFTWSNFRSRPKGFLRRYLGPRKRFFDCTIGEKVNLLYKRKKESAQLFEVLIEWIKQNDEQRCRIGNTQMKIDVNDEIVKGQLRALGYFD